MLHKLTKFNQHECIQIRRCKDFFYFLFYFKSFLFLKFFNLFIFWFFRWMIFSLGYFSWYSRLYIFYYYTHKCYKEKYFVMEFRMFGMVTIPSKKSSGNTNQMINKILNWAMRWENVQWRKLFDNIPPLQAK